MMVNKDHREVEQKTQQPTISHLVENKSIDAIEDDNKQRLHKAVTHSHMDSQNYPMHSNSTQANECDRLNKENTNGKDNIKQFSQPSKTPQENEDRQVIEQLIKRNKQRQELVGADEPLPKTNAFRQNRKKNDKPKQKERKQVKAMSNTKHTKQPNKGAFKSQTGNDKPLKKRRTFVTLLRYWAHSSFGYTPISNSIKKRYTSFGDRWFAETRCFASVHCHAYGP